MALHQIIAVVNAAGAVRYHARDAGELHEAITEADRLMAQHLWYGVAVRLCRSPGARMQYVNVREGTDEQEVRRHVMAISAPPLLMQGNPLLEEPEKTQAEMTTT